MLTGIKSQKLNIRGSFKLNKSINVFDKPNVLRTFEMVVSSEQSMKRSGRAWITLCPFHDDSKPSFALYQDTNSYYCFTCGEAGDSFNLIMKHFGFSFPAAKEYAQNNGLIQ